MQSVLTVPLNITVRYTGGDAASPRVKAITNEFLSLDGLKHIEQLLRAAGLGRGNWSLCIMKGIRPMRSTKKFNHVVVSKDGIQFQFKSEKEAGYQISLKPRSDIGVSLETICESLKKVTDNANRAAESDKTEGKTPPSVAAQQHLSTSTASDLPPDESLVVSDEDVQQLVEAVAQLTDTDAADTASWFSALLMEIGPAQQARRVYWGQVLREADRRKLIQPSGAGYVVSTANNSNTEVTISEATEASAVTPPAAVVPAAVVPATVALTTHGADVASEVDIVESLAQNPELPLLLAELVDLGLARRAARKSVAEANAELAKVESQIQSIMAQLNPDVVRHLTTQLIKN